MAPRPPPKNSGGRKSNVGTPGPLEDSSNSIAALIDRLSYADAPRPFKSASFHSRLPSRTATSSTTTVRKNAKQILALERERHAGGDGFLSAAHVEMRKRGEKIELGKKKKGSVVKKGNILNLMKGRKKRDDGSVDTPADSEAASERTTPAAEDDEAEKMDVDVKEKMDQEAGTEVSQEPRKEVITYLTPTAPPSLLPAKKYCDITGLHASYTDPRTKLRYKGLDVWHVVRGLGPGGDQAYLSLRNAQTALK